MPNLVIEQRADQMVLGAWSLLLSCVSFGDSVLVDDKESGWGKDERPFDWKSEGRLFSNLSSSRPDRICLLQMVLLLSIKRLTTSSLPVVSDSQSVRPVTNRTSAQPNSHSTSRVSEHYP